MDTRRKLTRPSYGSGALTRATRVTRQYADARGVWGVVPPPEQSSEIITALPAGLEPAHLVPETSSSAVVEPYMAGVWEIEVLPKYSRQLSHGQAGVRYVLPSTRPIPHSSSDDWMPSP